MPQCSSLAELNERNRIFWLVESARTLERLSNKTVAKIALSRIRSQSIANIDISAQSTLERELLAADQARSAFYVEFQSELGRRGGKAKRPSALRSLIVEYVSEDPNATLQSLERHLENSQGLGVIDDFTRDEITYSDGDGRIRTIRRSGLKHHLTRARKAMARV
jgi:hypothetical protein